MDNLRGSTGLETEKCSAGLTLKSAFRDGWFAGGMKCEPWNSRAISVSKQYSPIRPTTVMMECQFLGLFRFVPTFPSNVTR